VFTENELAYLREQRLGRLATARPDGTLQNSPVGFGWNPETRTIDIGGHDMAASRKYQNVEAGSKVAFVVDDLASIKPWRPRCLEIRGRAEAILEPAGSAAPVGDGPIIRIHPERILSWGIDPPESALGARNVT
jgi:pyridoxamine 5'-phosphate oxidase family protein